MEFQSIIETNRGCPFQCTYCYWGKGGLNRKYRHHSLERVSKELEWCAQNKIRYVFSADSNFGMHNRDMEIAKNLVELKKNTAIRRSSALIMARIPMIKSMLSEFFYMNAN